MESLAEFEVQLKDRLEKLFAFTDTDHDGIVSAKDISKMLESKRQFLQGIPSWSVLDAAVVCRLHA